MGILSFSDTTEESVLWSHYADQHRGVAFEVQFKIGPDSLFKMQYTNERPVIDLNKIQNPEGLNAYLLPILHQLISQKSPGWSYEREYRVFLSLSDCTIDNGHYFKAIADDYLVRVILGY